jgi:hypothetical protein
VVDLFADSFGAQDPVAGTITVGGLTFPLDSIADLADTVPEALAAPGAPCDSQGRCATVAYAAAFSHDGIHVGTLVQGLMANEFLLVLNDLRGTNIPLLTDAELFAAAVGEPSTTTVEIDIKPGSDTNPINPFSRGVIPVTILTSEDFDALTVDEDSVLFGPAEAEKRHRQAHVADVDSDGDLDLLLHFRTQETGIALGDTEACVIGQTYDGVPIEGCDSVRTVPPGGSGVSTTVSFAVSSKNCGLGAELALLLPPLMWLYTRRRRSI